MKGRSLAKRHYDLPSGKSLDLGGRTLIMGILNVTPDSFSDGGSYTDEESIRRRVRAMISEGADIIDVGGESTRPGFTPVPEKEELERVIPAIRLIKKETDIPVSVDTTKAGVAAEAIREGADLINDVSGLGADPEMGRVVAGSGLPCILMHDRGEICRAESTEEYLPILISEMRDITGRALNAGIKRDTIILDPGIGFSKTWEQNMMILANLSCLRETGFPILLGASRKSVIGKALGLSGNERDEATTALSVLAAAEGISFVRVHDVLSNKRAVMMAEALYPFRTKGEWDG